MHITLTTLQKSLLATAEGRRDGSLFPVPEALTGALARVRKAVTLLMEQELVREAEVESCEEAWRREGKSIVGAFITNAGRRAINMPLVNEAAVEVSSIEETPLPTKKARVLALLRREEGATLAEIVALTGWLPHTTRAALTGLRKAEHAIEKTKRNETTCYRIKEAA